MKTFVLAAPGTFAGRSLRAAAIIRFGAGLGWRYPAGGAEDKNVMLVFFAFVPIGSTPARLTAAIKGWILTPIARMHGKFPLTYCNIASFITMPA